MKVVVAQQVQEILAGILRWMAGKTMFLTLNYDNLLYWPINLFGPKNTF
jgi:hypothetical protein